jgi:hypothetical protein
MMDKFNKSHSDGTYRAMRAEHLFVVLVCSAMAIWYFREIDLWRFALLFLVIDVIGYVPGLVAYLRSGKGRVAPIYHYLYNVTHSYLTWGVVVFAWVQCFGWEWALLAVPIHLSGDRGIFGNVLKPADRSFEPSPPARSV